MRSDRFEYFATDQDQEAFFSKIDSVYKFDVVERCFDKVKGPTVFEGLMCFLDFMRGRSNLLARRSTYYASLNSGELLSRDIVGSDRLAEFDLLQNPHVLTLNCGDLLDHKRLLLSQIGRSKASNEATELLSKIKKMATDIDGDSGITATGELVLPNALTFANQGGRLVRTPDAPMAYDARIGH